MVEYAFPEKFLFSAIVDGEAYYVPYMETISSDGSINFHVKNPHTDKIMWLVGITIYSEGNVDYYLYDSFDSITNGSEITIQNVLMDSGGEGETDSGPFSAYSNSSFTATNNSGVPIGFTIDKGPASSNVIDFFPSALEPSREVVIELDNQDSSQNKALITVLLVTSY